MRNQTAQNSLEAEATNGKVGVIWSIERLAEEYKNLSSKAPFWLLQGKIPASVSKEWSTEKWGEGWLVPRHRAKSMAAPSR